MTKYIASSLLTAFLCSSAFAGPDGPHPDGVIASFHRMLNHQPVASVHSSPAERDALQEAFVASLWNGVYVRPRQPVADALAYPGSNQRRAGVSVIEADRESGQMRP